MKKIESLTQKSNIKRIVIEILIGLGIIFLYGEFGYIFVLSYFLYRFMFLKFNGADDDSLVELVSELSFVGLLLFYGTSFLLFFYRLGYTGVILFLCLIIYLFTIFYKGKK